MKWTIYLFLILLLPILLFVCFVLFTDRPVWTAQELYPLGNNYIYFIRRNRKSYKFPDGELLSSDSYYTLTRLGEEEQPFSVFGRALGKPEVDLEPFLNTPVHLEGRFKMGPVWFFSNNIDIPNNERYRLVLIVSSVRKAD